MQHALEMQVQKSFEKLGVTDGSRVGVAVSGGVDSMVLLHCLCSLRAQLNLRITAYHMEHGIRAESQSDMRFVMEQCEALNVPCIAERADVPAMAAVLGISLETAARDARYRFLDAQDEDYIATAHQMDDMAETVILNLLRGSGLAGLCGIPMKRGKYIRPLLGVSRRQIEAYAKEKSVAHVNDSTNSDTAYTRNFVRHELLPRMARVNENAAGNIARTAALLAEDEAALADMARRSSCVELCAEGAKVDIKKLKLLMPAVQKRVLRLAVKSCCGLADIESVHVDAMLDIAKKGRSAKRVDIGNGCFAAVVYNKLLIGKIGRTRYNNNFKALDENCEFGGLRFTCEPFAETPEYGAGKEYFDADSLKGTVLRRRQRGDVITPLGMAGTKRLSDYLSDRKVPLHRRDAIVLLAKEHEVLWAVGVGVSEKSRVRPDGKIVKINYWESGYARGFEEDTIQRGADQTEGKRNGSPDKEGL